MAMHLDGSTSYGMAISTATKIGLSWQQSWVFKVSRSFGRTLAIVKDMWLLIGPAYMLRALRTRGQQPPMLRRYYC